MGVRGSIAESGGSIKGDSNRRRQIPRVAYAIHSEGLNNSNISAVSAVSMNRVVPNRRQQSASLSLKQYQQYINDRRRQTMIIGSMVEYQKQYQQGQSGGPPIVAAGFPD
jgi:hypothetical protein